MVGKEKDLTEKIKRELQDSFLEDKFLNVLTVPNRSLEYLIDRILNFLETRNFVVFSSSFYDADVDDERGLTVFVPEGWDVKTLKGIIVHEFLHVYLDHFSLVRDFKINPYIANIGFDIFINSLIKGIDPKGVLWKLPDSALTEEDFDFFKKPVYKYYNEVEICQAITKIAEKDEKFRKSLITLLKSKETGFNYILVKGKRVKVSTFPKDKTQGRKIVLGSSDFISQVKELKKVNWDSILINRIQRKEEKVYLRKNYRKEKKNRIYLKNFCENVFFPSNRRENERFVFFVVDTSTSMSQDLLKSAKELIISLLKSKPTWKVIEVHHSFLYQGAFLYENGRAFEVSLEEGKISKVRKVSLKETLLTVKGRGGTSHLDVFETLYPFKNRGEFIFVTDGMSDLEISLKKYPFFKNSLFIAPDVSGVYYLKKAGIPFVYYLDSHTVRYAV